MPCSRELTHVGADLGEENRDRGLGEPQHVFQSFDGVAKGRKRGLDPPVKGGDCRFQLFDGLEMLIDQEATRRDEKGAELCPNASLLSLASSSPRCSR